MTSVERSSHNRGKARRNSNSDSYKVEFDRKGNPTSYSYTYHDVGGVFRGRTVMKYDYRLEYDTTGKLKHIRETRTESISKGTHDETDVYFYCDALGRLVHQVCVEKYIYTPGSTYRGASLSNDTFVTKMYFNYDSLNRVSEVYKERFANSRPAALKNTLKMFCSFDSVFIARSFYHNERMEGTVNLAGHSSKTGYQLNSEGRCATVGTADRDSIGYDYNSEGKLVKSEAFHKDGTLKESVFWTYFESGLIQKVETLPNKRTIIYAYEFYSE